MDDENMEMGQVADANLGTDDASLGMGQVDDASLREWDRWLM